jgi:hypothetical protein
MFVRVIRQKSKAGKIRSYTQIVRSYRRPDGMPATEVIAHLGPSDKFLVANLKQAFAAARRNLLVEIKQAPSSESDGKRTLSLTVKQNLAYLPIAVVSFFFRDFGLRAILDGLDPSPRRSVRLSAVVEALVAHRCVRPGSKLAFQRWLGQTAVAEIVGVAERRLNNTRVHRVLDELAQVEGHLQDAVAANIASVESPRVLFLDLTDTWFDEGGGSLARRGQTKAGHRSKWKIHIALLVNQKGLPMRWELLPGALCETTVLPHWIDDLHQRPWSHPAVLVFDRGMSCVTNLVKLVGNGKLDGDEGGRLFLTSVKSDMIPTCVGLDQSLLDALQSLPADVSSTELAAACSALSLEHFEAETYARDLGVVKPPDRDLHGRPRPPRMRMHLYFNREIQLWKRQQRLDKIDRAFRLVGDLNENLAQAKKPRKAEPTTRKVSRLLEKLQLLEIFDFELEPFDAPGKTKPIASFQVGLKLHRDQLRNACRYDGLTLLVAHPKLDMTTAEAISAYRAKNVVEADFRTIKSVLQIRPTFHWTDNKIQSHVTICVLALLVERLIEDLLARSSLHPRSRPSSAHALLQELAAVNLNRLKVNGTNHTTRTDANQRVLTLLKATGTQHLLDACHSTLNLPQKAP